MLDDESKQLISRYVDGRLDQTERGKVTRLLESSSEARDFHEGLVKLGKMTAGFQLQGDDDYWERQKKAVLDKIKESEAAGITPARRRLLSSPWFKLAAVAASVALVVSISIFESLQVDSMRPLFEKSEAGKEVIPSESMNIGTKEEKEDYDKTGLQKYAESLSEKQSEDKATADRKKESDEGVKVSTPPPVRIEEDIELAEEPAQIESGAEKPAPVTEPPVRRMVSQDDQAESGTPERRDKGTGASLSKIRPSDEDAAAESQEKTKAYDISTEMVEKKPRSGEIIKDLARSMTPEMKMNAADKTTGLAFWRARRDSLETVVLSADSAAVRMEADERSGVGGPTASSSDIQALAEAYFKVGTITSQFGEKEASISGLRSLHERADSSSRPVIELSLIHI